MRARSAQIVQSSNIHSNTQFKQHGFMARKSTIKLLLINESENEGERLVSLFRNAGRVARAHRATSAEDLHKKLEKDHWDLLIANDKHPEIAVEQCLEQLQKLKIDLPSIIIRDDNAEAALALGASDIINSNDDQRLIYAAFRELKHLEKQRELTKVKEKLIDAEERSTQLMAQSQDAIAYVTDGMIINANQLFCTRFGYETPDDLDCVPIVDLIDTAEHDKFKGLLKTQIANGEGKTDLNFNGCSYDGDIFSASMQLSNSVFDDENCIQLLIRDQLSNDSAASNNDHDAATGLYNQSYFLSQLDSCAKQALAGTTISTLAFIGIDKYADIRRRLGISNAHKMLLAAAQIISENSTEQNCLTHFCDDGFTMLLIDSGFNKAKTYAQSLCEKLGDHILEIEGNSIQCTASIGLLVLDAQIPTDINKLIDGAFSACEQVRRDADNDGIGNNVAQFVPTREKLSLGNAQNDNELDTWLEEALEDEKFSLGFQPIVSLRGTAGEHYEVRSYITDDNGEVKDAREFLKTLNFQQENTRFDRWVILETTKLLAGHVENKQDTRLFINLTANALQDKSLIAWLTVALKAGGIPPEAIIFQFEESDISNYLKPAKAFAKSIKELGCKISISSFGEINDPVKILKQISADFTKISSTFTQQDGANSDPQILKSMVTSINENSTQAIIDGVENASALAMLWQIGVDYIQGGYLAGASATMDYEFTDIA
jgi:diguanylate cyclase (GGDEF)-like protein